ncbi:MAG: P-loop NTPase [Proteobacteria bacterium]|nr:P-loop NTPase [Pseudomonadota bacterium]
MPGIRHIVAVGSAKGGVGKSTVAVNLALTLKQHGLRVGLVDADVLGPSIPGMLGLPTGDASPRTQGGRIVPAERHGVEVMSMGLLTGDDAPAVLRGPMVSKYLRMFIGSVAWSPLDYLLLDLPPGTGDTQLTLTQSVPLSGALIVTTPQDVSLKITRRGVRMFEKVRVPILGIVENMSTFSCPHCGETTDIFRHGGGERLSEQLGVPFLGAIPLDADIVTAGDEGCPITANRSDSPIGLAYARIGKALAAELRDREQAVLRPFQWTWDSNDGAPAWIDDAVEPTSSAIQAVGLKRRDARTLSVLWRDGRQDDIDVRDLRLACRCALCVEEMSGRPLLDPDTVPDDVAPRTITSVGNYAIAIGWSDGHNSGIHSFTALRELGSRASATGS